MTSDNSVMDLGAFLEDFLQELESVYSKEDINVIQNIKAVLNFKVGKKNRYIFSVLDPDPHIFRLLVHR